MSAEPEISPSVAPLAGGARWWMASAALLGGAMVVAKLIALIKERMVADQFGAADAVDAYWMGMALPSFALAIVSAAIPAGLLPSYVRASQQGPAEAKRLFASAHASVLASLVFLTSLLAIAAPFVLPMLALGFDADKLALTRKLFYEMLGLLVAGGLASLWATVLNAHERFRMTALAPLAPPTVMVAVFYFFREPYGIEALAVGTLLGFVAEAIWLAACVALAGYWAWPRFGNWHPHLPHVGRQAAHAALGGGLVSAMALVDQTMAASLSAGAVSVLNYAHRIPTLILNIVAVSVGTVLFSRFARMAGDRDWPGLRRMLRVTVPAVLVGSIPIVAALLWWSEPLVALLFERGEFTSETTGVVSGAQRYYLLQVPFYVLALIGGRLLSALDANQAVQQIATIALIVSAVGNLVLMRWLGVSGIALATSLAYVVACIATLIAVYRRTRGH